MNERDATVKPVLPACTETNSHDQGRLYYGQSSCTVYGYCRTPGRWKVWVSGSIEASLPIPVSVVRLLCNIVYRVVLRLRKKPTITGHWKVVLYVKKRKWNTHTWLSCAINQTHIVRDYLSVLHRCQCP